MFIAIPSLAIGCIIANAKLNDFEDHRWVVAMKLILYLLTFDLSVHHGKIFLTFKKKCVSQ